MVEPPELTTACQDRDFREWRGEHEHAAAWVILVDQPWASSLLAAARARLAGCLLPRYRRQAHVTVSFAGLLGPGGYTAGRLAEDLHLLRGLATGPLTLLGSGWGSFRMVPYLRVRCPGLAVANAQLCAEQDRLHGMEYQPHLSLGHYSGEFPISSVLARLMTMPVEFTWVATRLTLVRFQAADIAGPLAVEGELDLTTGTWTSAPGALLS